MNTNNKITARVFLPYFKQGDDLHHALEKYENIPDALLAHAEMLESAADELRAIESEYSKVFNKESEEVEIFADTHYIGISGPEFFINKLDELGLAEIEEQDEWVDEDDLDTELEN